ncbi:MULTISPECIES: flagellar hook-basal body complex protein [unclassified Legionella]|uniref:flagellar hook-basal body complex protein n=1 Tax=unclassified Legionella TaxID=2622702 RepID=UPI001054F505|nr:MULTISPECIES: flagellar hook-basal body complex protein [unclassified Legionella]MDI9817549.1 flagellar hook-basal body complex protein [Legionella sp. PL877]
MNTYYTSLSGMFAASYGLQNTSNNVANMQSPGFKRTDLFYSSLGSGYEGLGSGVCIGGSSSNFSAGRYLETANPSDLAIVGQGFFIVKLKNGELLYTRDGEFGFDNEGMMIDKHSGGLVQGYNAQGNLAPIHQFGPETLAGKATRYVNVAGEFILVEKEKDDAPKPPIPQSKFQNISFELNNIFDAKGKSHKVRVEFKAQDPLNGDERYDNGQEWELVKLICDGKELDFQQQTLRFTSQLDGYAEEGSNAINLTINNNQMVTLKFGSYQSDVDKCVRLKKSEIGNSETKIHIDKQDGYGEGKQIGFSFDDNGQISYNYSNGHSTGGIHVALATFDDMEHQLIKANDNLFRAKDEQGRKIGRANKDGFGAIQSKKLESSNVDSTTEFANIVVLQRMFQACSQIMDIDKQLLEELAKK